ncbi:MAG: D-alanyl-D-alanine carboxypeptidase family protein [Oscillospiraceae bacterium]
MLNLKKLLCGALCFAMLAGAGVPATADGTADAVQANSQISAAAGKIMEDVTASEAVVMEATTGTVVAAREEDAKAPASHFAKLMTVLLTCEAAENGAISGDTKVTASSNAFNTTGTKIWLNSGEEITVDELLKAITVGNANDACVALAEKIGGSEQDFTDRMNARAKSLGMDGTHYADCTGMSADTVTTALDTATLCAELMKHEALKPYLTTWMTDVRGGATELVSTNKLIRSYKGIWGMKACASETAGQCLAAAAERNGLKFICVLFDASSTDDRFSEATKLLNFGFSSYELYQPEIPAEALSDIPVTGGTALDAAVTPAHVTAILIPKGASANIKVSFTRVAELEAPVQTNTKAGELVLSSGDKTLLSTELVTCEEVGEMTFGKALGKLLLNLLDL